jgi:hypothetical protein
VIHIHILDVIHNDLVFHIHRLLPLWLQYVLGFYYGLYLLITLTTLWIFIFHLKTTSSALHPLWCINYEYLSLIPPILLSRLTVPSHRNVCEFCVWSGDDKVSATLLSINCRALRGVLRWHISSCSYVFRRLLTPTSGSFSSTTVSSQHIKYLCELTSCLLKIAIFSQIPSFLNHQ